MYKIGQILTWTNWICVIDLIFSQNKRRFQKKLESKKFPYSSEKPRRAISKQKYVKRVSLVPRNLKLNYVGNNLIPCKCPYYGRRNQNNFKFAQIGTREKKTVFKLNYVYRIVSLCENCK